MYQFYDAQTTTDFPTAYPADPLSTATLYPVSGSTVMNDTFLYKGQLIVTSNNVLQTITVNRIVGQLLFNIEDAMPANASTLTYDVATENTYYKFSANAPGGSGGVSGHLIGSFIIAPTDAGKKNYNNSIYLLNTATPMTVKLTVSDAAGVTIATKTITNVKVSANQKTTLTGKIFNTSPNSYFNVYVNQAWGSSPTTIVF